MDDEELAAAGSSECSSGCQSGWTTYLDDHTAASSYSCDTARFHHGKERQQQPHYSCDYSEEEEEEDLSMISDASSGPRQQQSSAGGAGNDDAATVRANAERRGRREQTTAAAAARRQNKRAAVASLLEDTASSPAFFGYSKAMSSGEANVYGGAGAQMTEIGNAADFSYAFSTTTGFKSPLNAAALSGYMQMQYPPATPVKPTMPRRQICRDASEKKRW